MFSCKKKLDNVLSVLIYSIHDNSYLLLLDERRGDYWLPSMVINDKYSWKENVMFFKEQLLNYETETEKLLKIFKIWTFEKEYFHLIFCIILPGEIKTNCKFQSQLGQVTWLTCSQIVSLKPVLRSLEVLDVISKTKDEMLATDTLTEIRKCDLFVTEKYCENQNYLDLLSSAKISVEEQYDFYEEFFIHTYPCLYMNLYAFKLAISKFNFAGDYAALFRAADRWKRHFLTFQDFLFLIAVMEPHTAHCGNLGEIRCQYIFRFYDENRDGKINYHEFQKLIIDIEKEKNATNSKFEENKLLESITKSLGLATNSNLSFDQFFNHVLQSKICDTSLLLRFSQENFEMAKLQMNIKAGQNSTPKFKTVSKIIFPLVSSSEDKNGFDVDYQLIFKTTLLKPDAPMEIKDLQFFEGIMTKSVSEDLKVLSDWNIQSDPSDLNSKINEILLALRYFRAEISQSPIFCGEFEFDEKEPYTWGTAYLEKLGITLIMICEQLKTILRNEPRLLEIYSPVYIMGDLHGNFHDLMCFEKTLWPNGICLAPTKLLFLGDYVDRGFHSLEVVMYLFANKIQNPDKLYLIRGNHEIRDIQRLFTFQRECNFKLGVSLGTSVWKAVNDVFDVMPLAAIVDHKIFCCHGGIPPPWLCPVVSVINSIPCPLVNCERQSPLAWTLMWNDPLKNVSHSPVQELELFANEGFVPNVQRGTGYVFSSDALDKFLKINELSYVIRAHELVKAGFQIHQKGKLLTVFSSSGYCGGKNHAASVLVADKLLRVFMVDTGIS